LNIVCPTVLIDERVFGSAEKEEGIVILCERHLWFKKCSKWGVCVVAFWRG